MSRSFSSKDTVGVIVLAVVAVAMIVGGVKIFSIAFTKDDEQPTDNENKTVTMIGEPKTTELIVTTPKTAVTEVTKATTAPAPTEESAEQIKAEAIMTADIQSQQADYLGALVTIRMAIEEVGEDAELNELASTYESMYKAQLISASEPKTEVQETTEAAVLYANDVLTPFNPERVTLYSELSDTEGKSFQMAGETYENGVVFCDNAGEPRCFGTTTSSISYNIKGYSKMSFYLGHQDNTAMEPMELKVYLDDKIYESYSMSAYDFPKPIEIDVQGKTFIRFTITRNGESGYCLADLKIE